MNRNEFITVVAQRAGFTKKDIDIILNTIQEVIIDAVSANIEIKIKGLFKIYSHEIPSRKGRDGSILPPAKRVTAKLSRQIKSAGKPFLDTEDDENEF